MSKHKKQRYNKSVCNIKGVKEKKQWGNNDDKKYYNDGVSPFCCHTCSCVFEKCWQIAVHGEEGRDDENKKEEEEGNAINFRSGISFAMQLHT
eukprot:10047036-Ditylum_brightwellii.AAC.1